MTTTPRPLNQKSKPLPQFGFTLRAGMVGLAIVSIALQLAAADTGDDGEQLHRRGYPDNVSLEWAVSDYNSNHRADSVARSYPELDATEIPKAVSQAITETPKKNKQKLARLAALQKFVLNGKLPKGSILTFQYSDGNRTSYWFRWGTLSNKFSIFLISGLDENPPGEGGYNEKAFITGVLIRSYKRIDQEWKDQVEKMRQESKR